MLYQVVTTQLSPEDIASPEHTIFQKNKNITVLKGKVGSVYLDKKFVMVECGNLHYDKLILSVGVRPDYFGIDNCWKKVPPLKTLENALKIRNFKRIRKSRTGNAASL